MTTLLLTLSLARVVMAGPLPATPPPAPRCERFFSEDLVAVTKRMKTLRTIPTHTKSGLATPILRLVLEHHLPDVFPEDARVLNQTLLPKFEIKAEYKISNEGSSHAMFVLKIPNGPPAALVHYEEVDGDVSFMSLPLGEGPMRELRDQLLEAYQLRGQFGGQLPHGNELVPPVSDFKHFWLFADDRLRLDPHHKTGMAYTDYEDLLAVTPKVPGRVDAWGLTVRRDSLGFTLVRGMDGNDESLDIFAPEQTEAAITVVSERIAAHIVANARVMNLDLFFGEDPEPVISLSPMPVEEGVAPLVESVVRRVRQQLTPHR